LVVGYWLLVIGKQQTTNEAKQKNPEQTVKETTA
jgi:hypothetical protein